MSKPITFDPFIRALRARKGKVPADLYADIQAAWEAVQRGGQVPLTPPPDASGDPAWLRFARAQLGQKEIPGAAHNGRIVGWFKQVGAGWFKDDETPWCGAFVGYCLIAAGLPIVDKGLAVRAKAWATWGKPTEPRVGAVAVFGREGGGHVGFAVGISVDGKWLHILGGNQSNAVTVMKIASDRLIAMRWPASLPMSTARLPVMADGVVSTNER